MYSKSPDFFLSATSARRTSIANNCFSISFLNTKSHFFLNLDPRIVSEDAGLKALLPPAFFLTAVGYRSIH